MEIFSRLPFATFVTRFIIKTLLLFPPFHQSRELYPFPSLFKERFLTSSSSPFSGKFFSLSSKKLHSASLCVYYLRGWWWDSKKMATTTFFPHIKRRRRQKMFLHVRRFLLSSGKRRVGADIPLPTCERKGCVVGGVSRLTPPDICRRFLPHPAQPFLPASSVQHRGISQI